MKNTLIYSTLIISSLIISGCGGSDDSTSVKNQENPQTPNTELTEQLKKKIIETSAQSHILAAKESFAFGMVDTALYGVDEVLYADAECESGQYKIVNNQIDFNECSGLFYQFEGDKHQSLVAKSGTVINNDGDYTFKNLVLENPITFETKTFSGTLKSLETQDSAQVSSESFSVKASEKNGTGFRNVAYLFENYQLQYTLKTPTELNISSNGQISVQNSAVGDYKIKFITTDPLAIKVNQDEEREGLPYRGAVKIENTDLKSTTLITSIPNTNNVQYQVLYGNQKLVDNTQTWTKIFGTEK